MYFARFNPAGELIGRFDSMINRVHDESGALLPAFDDLVELSDSQFRQTIFETDGIWKLDQMTGEVSKHAFPPPQFEELVKQTQATAREMRLPIIGILDGMQSSALTNGDLPRAKAIETAKTGLKNITKVDLSGCATADEMRAAVFAAYLAIAKAAPVEVQTAFAQVLA